MKVNFIHYNSYNNCDSSVTINVKNLKILARELYKTKEKLSVFLHLPKGGHFGILYLKLTFSTIGQNFS